MVQDLLQKPGSKKAEQQGAQPQEKDMDPPGEQSEEPITRSFLEQLFGTLGKDFAGLRQHAASDIKQIRAEIQEIGDQVDSLGRNGDRREEITEQTRELLELRDRNEELYLRLEDLENCSRRSNIRIKGVPLLADGGKLEEWVIRFFRHVAPALGDKEIILDSTHRAGRRAMDPGTTSRYSYMPPLFPAEGDHYGCH